MTDARKPVTKRLRYEILRRDNHACRYCGATAPDVKLTVDHVTPVALGGTNDPTNLVTACVDCNSGKASTSPEAPVVADVSSDALRWAAAMAEARVLDLHSRGETERIIDHFDQKWSSWTYGHDEKPVPRDAGWRSSIEQMLSAGLVESDFLYATKRAMDSKADPWNTWRYFCGVCWRILSDRQKVAKDLLAQEDA